ncbi:hypothetical protein N9Y26_01440 [bacterium]|nr:hypothetical protein [bacterium]
MGQIASKLMQLFYLYRLYPIRKLVDEKPLFEWPKCFCPNTNQCQSHQPNAQSCSYFLFHVLVTFYGVLKKKRLFFLMGYALYSLMVVPSFVIHGSFGRKKRRKRKNLKVKLKVGLMPFFLR